ncbi:MAG: AAA family ATPase [Nitrospira sp.]|nr:AAA family ATPase [Nitrospira sp.]
MKQLAMEGNRAFSLGLNNVNFRVERISNNRIGGASGTLMVKLWALQSPFEGGKLNGYIVGVRKLQPLNGGDSIRDLNVTVTAETIPNGYYYPILTLEERDSDSPNGWYIMDLHAFDKPAFFGKRLIAKGMRLQSSSAVEVSLSEISNQTREATGLLRVSVWATSEPYSGGAITGFRLGSEELGTLAGGKSYRDLAWRLDRTPVTETAKFAVLLLEEKRMDEQKSWHLQDYCSVGMTPIVTPLENEFAQSKRPLAAAQAASAAASPTTRAEPEIKEEDIIGQGRAKAALHEIIAFAAVNEERRRRGLSVPRLTLHAAFMGSPGTGKTTFARFYAQQIRALGLLQCGHLIEVSRSDLVAEYMGQTAVKTAKAIESALGGVLFIDEAYALKQHKEDGYGDECIDTLVKKMEDHRDELVIIFAGYSAEMREFLRQNTGLESRVPNVIEFEDFDDTDLGMILDSFCKRERVSLPTELRDHVVEQIAARRHGRTFGNARDVRNIFERALARQAVRLGERDLKAVTGEELSRFELSDFKPDSEDNASKPHERIIASGSALEQLLGLVGLANIKRDVRETTALIRVERVRHRGRGLSAFGLHRLYAGAPGTGKRTVARLFAVFLRESGLLARGHIIEVSRADLIAGYVGQTSLKTRERVEEAMGGVLYVDDAPSLWRHKEKYDIDAIEAIIDAAEAHRDKVVVILAGDIIELNGMFEQDPRLRRVFPTPVEFNSPSTDELLEIGCQMAAASGDRLDALARSELRTQIDVARAGIVRFANGNAVRDLLERAYKRRALRLEKLGDLSSLTPSLLHALEREDFVSSRDT